jgi:hypothetical protein
MTKPKWAKAMSENDYPRVVDHLMRDVAQPMITTAVAIEAVQKVGALAAQEEIEWALAEKSR